MYTSSSKNHTFRIRDTGPIFENINKTADQKYAKTRGPADQKFEWKVKALVGVHGDDAGGPAGRTNSKLLTPRMNWNRLKGYDDDPFDVNGTDA